MITRWEYRIVPLPVQPYKENAGTPEERTVTPESLLNDFGMDGWEAYHADTMQHVVYMKRPLAGDGSLIGRLKRKKK